MSTALPKKAPSVLKSLGLGGLLLFLSAGLLAVILIPYYSAWLSGGTTWEASDFSAPAPKDPLHFLTVKAILGDDTGYIEETRASGIVTVGQDFFGYIFVDNNTLLITKSNEALPTISEPTTFVGSLKPFEADVGNRVVEGIRSQLPTSLKNGIYPRLFDITEAENKATWIIGGVICVIVLWVSLNMLRKGFALLLSRRAERSI